MHYPVVSHNNWSLFRWDCGSSLWAWWAQPLLPLTPPLTPCPTPWPPPTPWRGRGTLGHTKYNQCMKIHSSLCWMCCRLLCSNTLYLTNCVFLQEEEMNFGGFPAYDKIPYEKRIPGKLHQWAIWAARPRQWTIEHGQTVLSNGEERRRSRGSPRWRGRRLLCTGLQYSIPGGSGGGWLGQCSHLSCVKNILSAKL